MGARWDKFVLLMWKNWILQLRHPVQTLFEILVPVFFCSVLVLVRSLVDSTKENQIVYKEYKPDYWPLSDNYDILYSPNITVYNDIMELANFSYKKSLVGYPDRQSLDLQLNNANNKIGIAFPDVKSVDAELPKKIEFTLRFPAETKSVNPIVIENWRTNLLFPVIQMAGPRDLNFPHTARPEYYSEGFLAIQNEVNRAILGYLGQDVDRQTLYMSRFPYPEYYSDMLLSVLQKMIGLIIVLAFVYTSISTIKVITAEKEKQLKESMKIMGLPNWLHWTAWFMKSLSFMLISIVLMVFLLKAKFWYSNDVEAVFPKSDVFLMFIFLLLYCCSIITLCFSISVFFTKANMAAGIGGVLFFLFLVPFSLLQNHYEDLSLSEKLLASLMSNSAMAYGFQIICMFESTEEGLQWNNIWSSVTPDDTLVMGHIFVMLIIDSIIYFLIAIYVEAVFPGKYGVPKKWNFIFTCLSRDTAKVEVENGESVEPKSDTYEREPNMKAGIEIKHLGKVYANKKVAVKDLSLNMFEDQITVLLGHNGAGKTTTMSMLTGMFPPTSGTSIINGYDICKEINHVRSSLGLCPQHNILFDELTVSEHIYFYSKLKGMDKRDVQREIDQYVALLELEDKRNKKSCTLSGGMKRKLSVAVAFCGNSKVVMLDEPTAGMDPAARRALWELVESQKKGRTIMLTTHFMDEADLLGDRIAIMAGGQLQCCGSSFFLKKKYGAGYHLVMDKSPNCDINDITNVLKAHIPNIKIESNVGSELTFLLNEEDSSVFKDMLKDIERESESLGIRSYGISLTTLEEVFMKVGTDFGHSTQSSETRVEQTPESRIELDRQTSEIQLDIGMRPILMGFNLYLNHFKAMFLKRFLITMRSWAFFVVQMLIPILLLTFAIFSGRNSGVKDLPAMKISLDSYNKPVTVLGTTNADNELYNYAKKWLSDEGKTVLDIGSDNMVKKMLEITKKDKAAVRMHYLLGAEFRDDSFCVYFNNDPYHTPPLALQFAWNMILKQNHPDYEITVTNAPMPFKVSSLLQILQQGNNMGFQLAVNIGFCMAFISAFYILFYIRERICKIKHLQIVSGVNIHIFWIVSFLWDCLTYIITVICLIITLLCFQEDGFKSSGDIGRLIIILTYFGFGMLPLIYLMSFIFKMPSSGFIRVILFTMVLGTFAFMVVEILSVDAFDLTHIANILDWILLFVPHYSLSTGIRNVNIEYMRYTNCKKVVDVCVKMSGNINSEDICWRLVCIAQEKQCCRKTENYYQWEKPGILRNIIISMGIGTLMFVILFLKETRVFTRIKYAFMKKNKNVETPESEYDTDVFAEKTKIEIMTDDEMREQSLVLRDVTKYYKDFLAVNGICLGVNRFECFGLLGVNGAGKTSTFKMITGDTSISHGDVFVNGLDLKKNMKKVNKVIGYCPQFDALFDDLTAKETITMFCLLRGFPRKDCSSVALKLSKDFDFTDHLNKKVRELSGGNKRKLSTALAIIGDPPILYLDEPTTGMDPATKRYLWDTLCKLRDSGKCLILTSHSMEECEALCTRLAIMVNGQFKCLGSTQHLKNKFSQGFTLILKLRKPGSAAAVRSTISNTNIEEFITEKFPGSVIREHHQELITFYIPSTKLPWSEMFGIMESAKIELNIEDYSIGQTSLEQVFLQFTKMQN
ncbi:PREDICTED: ATP-binding cassette sub-family A member 3 [Nicrophorus vespilloides]|uniref:ATP-binding cassette sub-family A member 3 n=1 Tax=Nicrophorus vespilloides TaxID=110193 RepID=A0ABM1M124_NICVS|nr:PREDICTED: ATP-binding cassette sub-family A member 3 [Nicrophorus vespilloides]